MRPDRKDAIQHEADELAAEAFNRYEPPIEQWVRDALVGEWGLNAENSAKQVMWAVINFTQDPADGPHKLRHAVGNLREAYVDHAGIHGLYAAEAEDAINCAAIDEAERLRDLQDDRAVDAYNAELRG